MVVFAVADGFSILVVVVGSCWLLLVVVCGWVLAVFSARIHDDTSVKGSLPRLPPVGVLYQPSILAMINHLIEVSNGA